MYLGPRVYCLSDGNKSNGMCFFYITDYHLLREWTFNFNKW